jgi:hypothetical protein
MNEPPQRDLQWERRIRGEYTESPGLTLSLRDAERLWGLDTVRCRALLDALVETRFLRRTKHGAYARDESG